MTTDEILLSANRKWLAARGVTDWRTMRKAVRMAGRNVLRRFDSFAEAWSEWEFLCGLNPDGTEICKSPQLVEKENRNRRHIIALTFAVKEMA